MWCSANLTFFLLKLILIYYQYGTHIGGAVKGGQIKGQYPEDITDEGPLTLGRGKSQTSV